MARIINCFEESDIKNKRLPQEWQDQESLDDLFEFLQSNWQQRSVFFDDAVISSKQQFLSLKPHRAIRTNNYIGTIVFKGQQLNIFPKVFRESKDDNDTDELDLHHMMRNLVQWLQYCSRIEYPFISIKSKLNESEDLRELFVTLYLHYVKQALDYGPFYMYENKKEDLQHIRGHIDFKDYINHKIPNGLSYMFQCSYDEFEFDNIVNRIIKYTCSTLVDKTELRENKSIIRHILIRLNGVTDVRCKPNDCDGIRLSKLHRQYAIILSMSKMFLLNQTTSYMFDNQESFCFLFPTELLFEGFIGGYMQELLSGNATVKLQASELTLINDVVYEGQSLGKAFTMKHDILVNHKKYGLFVLDTKYKHMTRFKDNEDIKKTITEDVSQSDLYQVIEYAAHRDIKSAYLLYPMYRFEEEEPNSVMLKRKSVSGKEINVFVVRLPFIFEDNIEDTKKSLSKAIMKIFDGSVSESIDVN